MLYYIQIHQLSEIWAFMCPCYMGHVYRFSFWLTMAWSGHDGHDVDWCLLMLIDALWFWLVLNWCWLMLFDADSWEPSLGKDLQLKKLKSVISRFCKVNIQQSFTWYLLFHIEILEAKTPIGWLNFWTSLFHFLDTIASPRSYPCQSVGEWVSEWVLDLEIAIASPGFVSLFISPKLY